MFERSTPAERLGAAPGLWRLAAPPETGAQRRPREGTDRAPSVEARSRALDAGRDSGPGCPAAPAGDRL